MNESYGRFESRIRTKKKIHQKFERLIFPILNIRHPQKFKAGWRAWLSKTSKINKTKLKLRYPGNAHVGFYRASIWSRWSNWVTFPPRSRARDPAGMMYGIFA